MEFLRGQCVESFRGVEDLGGDCPSSVVEVTPKDSNHASHALRPSERNWLPRKYSAALCTAVQLIAHISRGCDIISTLCLATRSPGWGP